MIRVRRIIGPPRPVRSGSAPAEQRLEHADRHRRLGFGIEIGFDRDALEEARDKGEKEPRAETGIELGETPRRRLRRIDKRFETRKHFGVDRPSDRGDARIAAGLGPDLDEQPRLLRRLAEAHACASPQRTASVRSDDCPAISSAKAAKAGALRLIELAQALDDRLFGREGAVEIAGAHAGFLGDMLHRRRMEAMADKGALGGFQDALASLGV